MKKFQSISIFIILVSLLYSCGKSDPSPAINTTTSTGTTSGTNSGTTPGPTLSITNFSPKSAKPLSLITITGTGFGSNLSAVSVLINNLPYLDLVSVSPTSIVIKTNLATGTGKISVKINSVTTSSTDDFTALLQDLKIVSSSFVGSLGQSGSSQLGHQMSMYAEGFGTDTNKIFISFGGTKPVKANFIGPSGLAVGTIVPRYAQAGKVTLTVDSRTVTSDTDFNLDMSMSDFSPKTVSTGDTMKITGVGFTNKDDMAIVFNPDAYFEKPFNVTPTEMSVIVPTNAKTGYLKISVIRGTLFDVSDNKFTFIPRVSFNDTYTPKSGKVNDIIRINGDFGGADISTIGISFGGSSAVPPTSISGSDIYVKVPIDAKTGKITISRRGYASLTGSFIFTIL